MDFITSIYRTLPDLQSHKRASQGGSIVSTKVLANSQNVMASNEGSRLLQMPGLKPCAARRLERHLSADLVDGSSTGERSGGRMEKVSCWTWSRTEKAQHHFR